MPLLFLDTSVQIQRIVGTAAVRAGIQRHLTLPTVTAVTCRYVLMEYQRALVADFARVHRYCLASGSLREVLTWIASGPQSYRARSLARMVQITALALGEEPSTSLVLARDLLEVYLRLILLDRFHQGVTLLPDPIGCDLLVSGVRRQLNGAYTVAESCRKDLASCQLPEFLAAQHSRLQVIADHLANHPGVIKGQARVQRLLTDVLDDPRAALGQASCWPLGDIIIALQIPAGAELWTLDSDFIPLATALGFLLHQPNT